MTLTPMQAKLLAIIRQSIEDGDKAPTFEAMARAIGRRSKSTIMRLLEGLEERGAIRRLHHRHSAIEIVPSFVRELDVAGEKLKIWFEARIADDKYGVVAIKEWPEGLEIWVGGECRWRSWVP